MLTLNVIQEGESRVITGTVNGEKFNLEYNEDMYKNLLVEKAKLDSIETMEIYNEWVEAVKKLLATDTQDIITTACSDLVKSTKGHYHIKVDDKVSKKAVPEALVDVILESVEKGIDPSPVIKAWVRFLRNPNFTSAKAELFARYITATIVDLEERKRLIVEEGFIPAKAELRAIYNDVAITQEGLIVGKKYSRLLTKGWEIDPDTNKAVRKKLNYIGDDTIDTHTGAITEGDVKDTAFNEDLIFEPPMMGTRGDPFSCGEVTGHVIRVGEEHKLKGWNLVNCNDHQSCVAGLHVGGWQYVQSYKHLNTQLLECFIDPAEIGAICDIGWGDGALRVKSYFVFGATEGRNKGLYHSSHYAKMKDADWEDYKKDAIEKSNKLMDNLKEEVEDLDL